LARTGYPVRGLKLPCSDTTGSLFSILNSLFPINRETAAILLITLLLSGPLKAIPVNIRQFSL
jgi:hypothetical protein